MPALVAAEVAGTEGGTRPSEPVDTLPAGHAWERARLAWHLVLPALLAVALVITIVDPDTSSARRLIAAVLAIAMASADPVLRPEAARARGDVRRGFLWGALVVLLWLPLVLLHPAFFIVLTGIFLLLFTTVEIRPASWLAALLALEIAVANLVMSHASPARAVFTIGWCAAIAGGSIAFARWVHGIIDQSRGRQDLLDALAATRADLAAAERAAGVATERARLTAEIHDTLAQGFTSIVMLLQAVEADMAADPVLARRIGLAIDTARDGLTDARRLLADLAPAPLDGRSLADAIGRVAARFGEETGTSVSVDVGATRNLTPPVEVALLRAAQESLANIRKHARASTVRLHLDVTDRARLVVSDDGVGFDAAAATGGFGLRAMAERLALVDGRVDVSSSSDGTRIAVEIPVVTVDP